VEDVCSYSVLKSEFISGNQLLSELPTFAEAPNKRKFLVQLAKLTWEYQPDASSKNQLATSETAV
jgi:hypothetical protein